MAGILMLKSLERAVFLEWVVLGIEGKQLVLCRIKNDQVVVVHDIY